jgi:hypothetical protein
MNEDNRIYSKILRLENKIHKRDEKNSQKSEMIKSDSFSKKLNSLKSLLESAL